MIERLVMDGAAVARSDGTLHNIFPVAVYAAEGEALRDWVLREGRRGRSRSGSATASRPSTFARVC
jgi:hypothetical protein